MGKFRKDRDGPPTDSSGTPMTERKAKKRKRDEAVLDLPAGSIEDTIDDGNEGDVEDVSTGIEKIDKRLNERRDTDPTGKSKRRRKNQDVSSQAADGLGDGVLKAKKEKKKKQKKKEQTREVTESSEREETQGDNGSPKAARTKRIEQRNKRNKPAKEGSPRTDTNGVEGDPSADQTVSKNHRFIAFIGNLPYNTTTAQLTTHFASVSPTSIRHITEKSDPSRSKGYAFLEFDGYERMETCLRMFHRSIFGGVKGEEGGRRINVELTAGGGGTKSKQRQHKLKAKNEKLNEERHKRTVEEKTKKRTAGTTQAEGGGAEKKGPDLEEKDVHPTRRSRVPLR
ncbi:MAG: hypothetical protein M1817_001399 [Caeruleum heppii]|nr:MAG: hypothetical protein M1817_001399 [Caeruleum heppii]